MAATINFYDIFSESIGDGTIDLDTNAIKVALFTNLYTPNAATDVTFSALTNQVTGNGYTAGGETLQNPSWAQTGGVATFDAENTVYTASGGSIVARHYVIYDSVAASNNLIAYGLMDDTPADVTVTDGNTLTLQWNASGIFTLTA